MIDMYVILITQKEDWNVNRVPEKHKAGVKAELTARGYDEEGKKFA